MAMTLGAPSTSRSNAHSLQDNDTAPSFANLSGDLPPQYATHKNHIHPIWPDTKTSRSAPSLRANFVHDSPSSELVHTTSLPTLSNRSSTLKRGLQIPSRMGVIASGFKLPPLLQAHGVSKDEWKLFTKELKAYAKMSGKQLATYIGLSIGINIACASLFPGFGTIPAYIINYQRLRRTSHDNFAAAEKGGLLEAFTRRWNETYFEPLGLHVMIALPTQGNTQGMDITTSKLFRYQENKGVSSVAAGGMSGQRGNKDAKYLIREGHDRVKAIRKARIIFVPVNQAQNHRPQESGQVDIRDYFDGNHGGDVVVDASSLLEEPRP